MGVFSQNNSVLKKKQAKVAAGIKDPRMAKL